MSEGNSDRTDASQPPADFRSARCRVLGCTRTVSGKTYYQRSRICMFHCTLPSLTLDGREQRWCQQCGRFQDIAEFEGDRRTCRAKLDRHNFRRRKTTRSHSQVFGDHPLTTGRSTPSLSGAFSAATTVDALGELPNPATWRDAQWQLPDYMMPQKPGQPWQPPQLQPHEPPPPQRQQQQQQQQQHRRRRQQRHSDGDFMAPVSTSRKQGLEVLNAGADHGHHAAVPGMALQGHIEAQVATPRHLPTSVELRIPTTQEGPFFTLRQQQQQQGCESSAGGSSPHLPMGLSTLLAAPLDLASAPTSTAHPPAHPSAPSFPASEGAGGPRPAPNMTDHSLSPLSSWDLDAVLAALSGEAQRHGQGQAQGPAAAEAEGQQLPWLPPAPGLGSADLVEQLNQAACQAPAPAPATADGHGHSAPLHASTGEPRLAAPPTDPDAHAASAATAASSTPCPCPWCNAMPLNMAFKPG